MSDPRPSLRQQIEQLDQLHRDGVLSAELHQKTRLQLEEALVAQVLAQGPSPAAMAPAPVAGKPSLPKNRRLTLAMAAFVLLVGGLGYAWKGRPALWLGGDAAALSTDASIPAAPHALGNDQMAGMVQALAERLKSAPNDAEGWAMLARSYATLNQHAEAVKAYAKAVELSSKDATLMADYADSLAVQQGHSLTGAPMEWIQRALALEPDQPKALLLAGTDAFRRKAYAEAVRYWERVVNGAATPPALAEQARSALADARQAAGLPAGEPTAAKPSVNADAAAGAGGRVAGRVTLAPALAAQAKPEDTVFIVARPAQGPRMPLAVLRKQVKDLPTDFVLDDSLAMSPQARLSAAGTVVVAARVSRSGQAMPQPGDLEGVSAPVPVGQSGVKVEIRETVK